MINGHMLRMTISGTSYSKVNGEKMTLSPGTIQLIPGGNLWNEIYETPMTTIGFEISVPIFAALPRLPDVAELTRRLAENTVEEHDGIYFRIKTPVPPSCVHDHTECRRFQNLFEEYIALGRIPQPMRDQITRPFFDVFAQLYLYLLQRGRTSILRNATELRVMEIKEWMDQHFTEPISVSELAGHACLAPSRFFVVFHQLFGESPKGYLLRCRLHYAAELLAGTDLPVTSIIYQSGFNAQTHFNDIFKQKFHLSPRDYRKNRRGSPLYAAERG